MSVDLDDLEQIQAPPDFQRANGAPMVLMPDGKRKRMSRPSNYAKPLDDESALTNWRIDIAAVGVANTPSLQARYVALDFDDKHTRKELREAATQAGRGNEGSDIGTALHAMSQRWETDATFKPPSPYRESLDAYSEEMNRLMLVSTDFEQACVNVEHNAAGTFDRRYESTGQLVTPDGEVCSPGTGYIGDLKTNKRLDYSLGAYAVQMALYQGAEWYDVVNDEFIDTKPTHPDWAILMWMPADSPGESVAFWVDLRIGRQGIELAKQVKQWQRNWRNGEFVTPVCGNASPPADDAAIGKLVAEFDAEEITAEEADADYAEWMEHSTQWIKARLAEIRNSDEATTWVRQQWPDGVPTPKQGITDPVHMQTLLAFLDDVEAKYQIPFTPHPDPSTGHHREIPNPNNPKENTP